MIDKALGKESTTHRINETITLLKYKTYAAITQSKKIAVLNGLLDIQTGQVAPFNKLEFITNKLNVEYKEGVKSEQWEKFIDQVCPDDKELLQEWSGYLLIKGYPYHAIMWLYGPTGRNGKGTWARTMQAILGEANYSSVSIDEFDGKHRFAVFNLHDSLFNICSEPRTDRSLTIEMLQMLTGQDSVDAERKGVQERFKFKNGAKMTVMGNKFPNVDKPTDAFWDRLKLCKFPSRFVGKDQIADIEKSWLDDPEQRSGVLNWMYEGAKSLITNGFTATKTQQETIIQFKRASDSIGAFITECLEFNPQKTTVKAETYDYYKEYCDSIGVISESNKAFNEKLCNTPKIKNTSIRIGVGKVKTKVWKGITLKPLPEESPDDNELKTGTTGTAGTTYSPYTLAKYSRDNIIEGDTAEKAVPHVPTVPSTYNSFEPTVTSVTTLHTVENIGLNKVESVREAVTVVTPPAENKAWYVKPIHAGAKCECGKYAVSYELISPLHEQINRCEECYKNLRKKFNQAVWKQAEPELLAAEDLLEA
jgi:P4 family phage/plasmid primase-like protien